MASTALSPHFVAFSSVPGAGGGGVGNNEALNRILRDFCNRDSKDGASLALSRHVEEASHSLSREAFSQYIDVICDRVSKFLVSNDLVENLGALRAIDELLELPLGENASRLSRFSKYVRNVFESKREHQLLIDASRVLGHLVRVGGAMTADEVEQQITNALEWLRGDRVEHHQLAAVLILKEMAENAPTVFNVHVPAFVESIWFALRDPALDVRERAAEALRACLCVIERRETRWRVQWYYHMFEATQEGLGRNAPIHSIHGSLLAVGELLRNTGEFMMSRYGEVAEIVFRYIEHRNQLVRQSITSLLPHIAHFLRDRFVTNYSKICMKHILSVLKRPSERATGFVALGEMAGALDGELIHYLPTLISHIRDAITPRKGVPSSEALTCVGNIAKAMGLVAEPHIRGLLDIMFSTGLTPHLVEAVEQITISITSLLPTIQDRLLESISLALSKSHAAQTGQAVVVRESATSMSLPVSDISSPSRIQLALRTLAHFNFKGHDLLEFSRESVLPYLEDEDGAKRKDAALCCCILLTKSFSGSACAQLTSSWSRRNWGKRWHLVEEVVEKLLIIAVADADVSVRSTIFLSLHENGGFDEFLAQADILTATFAALNDEDFEVRKCAIAMAGRLSEKNPAYVLPALRRHLLQLLTYLEKSLDNKCKEESAKTLGCLIRSCERLTFPYVVPVQKALLAKLREAASDYANIGLITAVLVTVGDLARVGGFLIRQYVPELLQLIVDFLMDGAAAAKREVAITILGQVVQSTGYVISPYRDYPHLLGLLLKFLNGDLAWSTRREVLKVLGIMGALDPCVQKRNLSSLVGLEGDPTIIKSDIGAQIRSMDDLQKDLWPCFVTSEDHYSMIAVNSLMRVLRDPSLSRHHPKVVGSLFLIFKSMGIRCVPYLPKVLPDLFLVLRSCDDYLKEFITWKLGTLVSIVRQHIKKYLPELLTLISELWSAFSYPVLNRSSRGFPVLHLVEQLCVALNAEFRKHLPSILPCCIQVLCDAEKFNDYIYVPHILHTLEVFLQVFGGTLDEHMHLLVPVLIRLIKVEASVDTRLATISTLTRLIPRVQVAGHLSPLVHHLKRVLDEKNDKLQKDALDALCCLAYTLGEDFAIFIPSIHKLRLKHQLQHKEFEEIEGRLQRCEKLISGSTATKKLSLCHQSVVITDSLCEIHYDSYTDERDLQKETRIHQVNDGRLLTLGEASQRSTKEDWVEWMRQFSVELLRESPSPALRTCARLAQLQPFVGRELFAAGFVSCWAQLDETSQRQVVRNLETAFSSPYIPPEILAALLNLAEFMEHDERPLPIDVRLLGALAEKFRAFAKALHYKEMEFEGARSRNMDANSVAVVEDLIHINNQLHLREAAVGILAYTQKHLDVQLKESWYEKLQRWNEALKVYSHKALQAPNPHVLKEKMLDSSFCVGMPLKLYES
ncbi:hypothetical protein Droror1_Dr00001223 [Drosera rotundifolia]